MKSQDQNMKDVLFQKLGVTWYVFTEIQNEFVYSALPHGMDPRETNLELYHILETHLKKVSKISKRKTPEIAA